MIPSIGDIQLRNDKRALVRILLSSEWENFFNVDRNFLRSGASVSAREVANSLIVNSSFAWRVTNLIHTKLISISDIIDIINFN